MYIFDELTRVVAAHFDISTTVRWIGASACSIDLQTIVKNESNLILV
jgi:hypothetical protein